MPDTLAWLGHSTVRLELGDRRLLTDPVLGRWVGPLRRVGPVPPRGAWADVDTVLISHVHHDHLDLPSLRRLAASVRLIVPAGAGPLLEGLRVQEVAAGQTISAGGLQITAVAADHGHDRLGSRMAVQPLGFVIRGAGRTVYFAGDTGAGQRREDLGADLDVALLPVGGWGLTLGEGHLDPRQAAVLAGALQPRLAVPIHWGTLQIPILRHLRPRLGKAPGRDFVRWAAQLAPTVSAVVAAPGEVLSLD